MGSLCGFAKFIFNTVFNTWYEKTNNINPHSLDIVRQCNKCKQFPFLLEKCIYCNDLDYWV
jgi:hypothetical protein